MREAGTATCQRARVGVVAGGLALALAACGARVSDAAPPMCTPGASVQCACPEGGTGAQVCLPTGAFAECVCGPVTTPPVVAPAVAPTPVSPTPPFAPPLPPRTTPSPVRGVDWPAFHAAQDGPPDPDFMDPGTDYGEPTFADLTGDGWDEAIFVEVMFSGGTSVSSFVSVYSMLPGEHRPRNVHHFGSDPRLEQYGGDTRLDLRSADANGLVLTRAVFTEDDAMCCPSRRRVETWRWNGRAFVEAVSARRVEAIPMSEYQAE